MQANSTQAYCVKCKEKWEMKDPAAIMMKNGKPTTQGVCATCGTKMFTIGKGHRMPTLPLSVHSFGPSSGDRQRALRGADPGAAGADAHYPAQGRTSIDH